MEHEPKTISSSEKNAFISQLVAAPSKDKKAAEKFAEEVCGQPEWIPVLFEVIETNAGSLKFYSEKIIRIISEKKPEMIVPYFDQVVRMIESRNNFIKWGGIITLSNLIPVDEDAKFLNFYERYLDLIRSDSMITASNVIGNAYKIVVRYPEMEKDITEKLLAVSDNIYLHKGCVSPECKNIVIGNVIDCFKRYYTVSDRKNDMLEFVRLQRTNSRKQVAKKADDFLNYFEREKSAEKESAENSHPNG